LVVAATSSGDSSVHKSAWDDLFGVASTAATTSSGFDDKFDAFEPNGHVTGAGDEFSGLRGNASSSTLTAIVDSGSSPWSTNAGDVGGGDDLFGTGSFASSPFGGAETGQGSSTSGGGSRARPRPSAAASNAIGAANPFSIALHAVTANRCVRKVEPN